MIGKLHGVVLVCPEPDALARFYAGLRVFADPIGHPYCLVRI